MQRYFEIPGRSPAILDTVLKTNGDRYFLERQTRSEGGTPDQNERHCVSNLTVGGSAAVHYRKIASADDLATIHKGCDWSNYPLWLPEKVEFKVDLAEKDCQCMELMDIPLDDEWLISTPATLHPSPDKTVTKMSWMGKKSCINNRCFETADSVTSPLCERGGTQSLTPLPPPYSSDLKYGDGLDDFPLAPELNENGLLDSGPDGKVKGSCCTCYPVYDTRSVLGGWPAPTVEEILFGPGYGNGGVVTVDVLLGCKPTRSTLKCMAQQKYKWGQIDTINLLSFIKGRVEDMYPCESIKCP